MKNKFLPPSQAEVLRRKNFILKITIGLMALIFAIFIYMSYDYLAFKLLIAGNYVYTDTLDALYKQSVGEENFKGYYKNFDQIVIAAVTEKIRSLNGDDYTYLFTPQYYKYIKESEKSDALNLEEIRQLTEDAVYLRIPNISKYTRKFVLDNKAKLKPYKYLVFDLRGNYGGFIYDYYKISELFLDKNLTVGYETTRLPFFTRVEKTKNSKFFAFEKIIILQDEETASAAEGLIMALKENLGETELVLLGKKTFGKGIGQVTVPLTKGYAVKATVLTVETPSGGTIHKKGIEPDIASDLEGEALIAYAQDLLYK